MKRGFFEGVLGQKESEAPRSGSSAPATRGLAEGDHKINVISEDFSLFFEKERQEILNLPDSHSFIKSSGKTQNLEKETAEHSSMLQVASLKQELEALQLQVKDLGKALVKVQELKPLKLLRRALEEGGFSLAYRKHISGVLEQKLSYADLLKEEVVLKWAKSQFLKDATCYSTQVPDLKTTNKTKARAAEVAHVMVFYGPGGVGKTHILTQLAAQRALDRDNRSASSLFLLNLDNYKISARTQWETYANILNLPFAHARGPKEFTGILEKQKGVSIFFVDTAGLSIGQDPIFTIEESLQGLSPSFVIQRHLVFSATWSFNSLKRWFDTFGDISYDGISATGLDYAPCWGSIFSLAWEAGLSLAHLADGEAIPSGVKFCNESCLKELWLCVEQLFRGEAQKVKNGATNKL